MESGSGADERVHLIVKWSPKYGHDTVERHVEVVQRHGATWWGLFAKTHSEFRLADQWLIRLNEQLTRAEETFVFISGPTSWRTRLQAVERERAAVEEELIPDYYGPGGHYHLWVKLTDFTPIDRDELLRLLDPAAKPGRPVALGNQTNPLIVRLRRTPRMWWVNQGTSFARAHAGGYLWAPIVDKAGNSPEHWRTMRHLRVGDVVLNYANTRIRAWSQVIREASPASRPDPNADQAWDRDGLRVDVDYRDLAEAIDLAEIPHDLRVSEGGPFTKDGGVKQGYLFPLSDDFAAKVGSRFPALQVASDRTRDTSEVLQPDSDEPGVRPAFDLEAVAEAVQARGLRIPPEILATLVAALRSGKHVILTGPPGTAKTTLAEVVASVAARAGLCDGYVLTTATADWTTYETIGGLKPDASGLTFQEGHFLDAIRKNQWLVIDELNRSNFDRAFGQLFTVLSGQAVELPYERAPGAGRLALVPEGVAHAFAGVEELTIPSDWRVVATMNVFDKSLLFEMSFALMRRFAFIEVPSPPADVFEELIDHEVGGDEIAASLVKRLLKLRKLKDLGPAVFMDLGRFAAERRRAAPVSDGQLAFEGFYGYLLPQFEGIDEVQGEKLFKQMRGLVGPERAERLHRTLVAVLGLDLIAHTADDKAETDALIVEGDEPVLAAEPSTVDGDS